MGDVVVEVIKWLLELAKNKPLILALGGVVLILMILLERGSRRSLPD